MQIAGGKRRVLLCFVVFNVVTPRFDMWRAWSPSLPGAI
jgi:hypothetical protein